MARRRLHVQRRVGRLVRRPRGRARGLAGPPRGHGRGAQRSRERRAGAADRADADPQENRPESQAQRTERQQTRQENGPQTQAQRDQRKTDAQAAVSQAKSQGAATAESRGYSGDQDQAAKRAERDEIGRVLRLLEREIGAGRQRARPAEQEQLAQRRLEAPVRAGGAVMIMKRIATVLSSAALAASLSCSSSPKGPGERTFKTPEEAVRALTAAAKAGSVDDLRPIFGPEGKQLIDSSDPDTARRNREVFRVAVARRLAAGGSRNQHEGPGHRQRSMAVPGAARQRRGRLAIRHRRRERGSGRAPDRPQRAGGDSRLPHLCRRPAPLCRSGATTASPRVSSRGPSAATPAGRTVCTGRPARGQKRSPLGDLVAEAAEEGRATPTEAGPSPFHGYYFRILTAQGPAAPGGAKDYMVNGGMSGGFALVAWPAQYDATGVMTFVVNQDGVRSPEGSRVRTPTRRRRP